jgi:hypothetical protein
MRFSSLLPAFAAALLIAASAATGEEAEKEGDPARTVTHPPSAFRASSIDLNAGKARVSEILREIERQTGYRILTSGDYHDAVLAGFRAEKEPFWPLIDRLAAVSNNEYGLEDPG